MNEQPPNQPVQNPLTLVVKAKSPQDYAMLRRTVEHMQSMPPEHNPIVTALDRLASVHFARFVFIDPDQLAVITTYDGDFDFYINGFINEIGDVFDQLLAHVVDAPPAPARIHRDEFLEFIRAHDVPCVGTFYSAYPTRTVLDVLDAAAVSH